MAKLYPPYLEGTIPAFYGNSITVPFAMNRAVSKNDIKGFSLLIKTIQTGQQIENIVSTNYDISKGIIIFNITGNKYSIGQSYKIQIAYIDEKDSTVGYYSTVAVVKYTEIPTISIEGLSNTGNSQKYNYIGKYITYDISEKMYSSKFKIYDSSKKLIRETAEKIHNSLNDDAPVLDGGRWKYTATEKYDWVEELDPGSTFFIQFTAKTIGLMNIESPLYQIVQGEPIPLNNNITVIPLLNYDNGYMAIHLKGETSLRGKYALSRSDEKENFKVWNEIMRFTLGDENDFLVWKDFTLEQGIAYKYSIFMIDGAGNYSNRSISNAVVADFEDMFLFDGDRQLRIRFNPKVSSFKSTKVESKTDTIGGKFPYFFRNGHINYKEFPISGLLTHLSDDDGYFEVAWAKEKYEDRFSTRGEGLYNTQLNTKNIEMERKFKLKVLEWLTNGKPKLFRSPSEGNYIVRLMNVSLSPTDSLSRMIHSFNSTACEVMEYNHQNLVDTSIIKDSLLIGAGSDKFITKAILSNVNINDFRNNNFMTSHQIQTITKIKFNITTGSFKLYINDFSESFLIPDQLNIVNIPIKKYTCDSWNSVSGTCDIEYETQLIPNINENISSVSTIDVPIIQLSGIENMYNSDGEASNLLNGFLSSIPGMSRSISNTPEQKEYLSQIFEIKIKRRNSIETKEKYENNWNSLTLKNSSSIITQSKNTLYEVYDVNGYYIKGYRENGKNILLQSLSTLEQNLNTRYCLVCDKIDSSISPDIYEVKENETLILNSSDIDFSQYSKIRGNIFLDVELCCRLGSKVYTNSIDNNYLIALKKFQDSNYNSQDELENCLKDIQSYWKEGRFNG